MPTTQKWPATGQAAVAAAQKAVLEDGIQSMPVRIVDPTTGVAVAVSGSGGLTSAGSNSQIAQTEYTAAMCSLVNNSFNTGGFTSGVGSTTALVTSSGYNGWQSIEVIAVGTIAAQHVTLQLEGSQSSFAGTNDAYFPGIQLIGSNIGSGAVGVAAPVRTSGSIDFVAGNATCRWRYQILDYYRFLRITTTVNTLSGTASGLSVNFLGVPV